MNLDKLKLAIHVAISDAHDGFDPLKCQNYIALCNSPKHNFVKKKNIIVLLLDTCWLIHYIMCIGGGQIAVVSFVCHHPAHFISLFHFSTSATPLPTKQPPCFLNLEGPFYSVFRVVWKKGHYFLFFCTLFAFVFLTESELFRRWERNG